MLEGSRRGGSTREIGGAPRQCRAPFVELVETSETRGRPSTASKPTCLPHKPSPGCDRPSDTRPCAPNHPVPAHLTRLRPTKRRSAPLRGSPSCKSWSWLAWGWLAGFRCWLLDWFVTLHPADPRRRVACSRHVRSGAGLTPGPGPPRWPDQKLVQPAPFTSRL